MAIAFPFLSLAGFDPAIHVLFLGLLPAKTWVPGSSPGKAKEWLAPLGALLRFREPGFAASAG
jgi:hypothetical protein